MIDTDELRAAAKRLQTMCHEQGTYDGYEFDAELVNKNSIKLADTIDRLRAAGDRLAESSDSLFNAISEPIETLLQRKEFAEYQYTAALAGWRAARGTA